MGSPLPRGFSFRYIDNDMVAIVRGCSDKVYAAAKVYGHSSVAEEWAIKRFYDTYELQDGAWVQVCWDTIKYTEEK